MSILELNKTNKTMQKRSLINRIYRDLEKSKLTSHIYTDNDWSGKRSIGQRIIDTLDDINAKGKGCYDICYGEVRYEGVLGELGHRKVYEFTIIDADTDKELINGQMVCYFCGMMADPMSAYDVTVLMG